MEQKEALFQRLMNRANEPGNLTRDLGMTVTEITEGTAAGKIEFVPGSINPRHIVHGGAFFGVMDQLAGLAACTTGYGVVTINGGIDFLRPGLPGEKMTCRATIVKPGRRFTTVEAQITNDETGKLIAKGTFTYCMMEELEKTLGQVCV